MAHALTPSVTLWASAVRCLVIVLVVIVADGANAQNGRGAKSSQAGKAKPAKIRLPASVREKKAVDMSVAAVNPDRRSGVRSAASTLDGFVEQELLSQGIVPGERSSDETFLRRVYLDVAGRIPTFREATRFLTSDDPRRREKLIDDLLNSPDYVSNFYNFWADTLRLVDKPQPNMIAQPFLSYVKDSIAENKPYDQWVYEMLTADGRLWDNPAVGYQLRDDGMPLPYIDNTVRIFLGKQIGCAQCHDHPFDDWTQYQFYQLAAFTAGTRTRIIKGDPGFEKTNPANALINEGKKRFPKGRVPGEFQRLARANTYQVRELKQRMRLPHDYAYSDAEPKSIVESEVLWGEIPTSAQGGTPREQFAAWVTSPDNEQFSNTIVNRLWKRLLGVGLVEPIDDFREDNPCVNEALMAFLGEELIRQDFDVKELIRTVLYSQTYQRRGFDYDVTSGEPFYFPGPAVRRMTAEQVWDSLLTLAVHNPWPMQRPTADEMKPVMSLNFANLGFDEMKRRAERFKNTYFAATQRKEMNRHAYQGNVLCRASELPSPLPAEHFLRQFGQGDRETINGASADATVPQILAMFNGPITHVMLEPGSAMVDNVMDLSTTRERVDAIFLSVLTRQPTPTDRVLAAKEINAQRQDGIAFGNVIWALLNTREFLFIQ
ncbi:MAG: DUF1549 and DUF1553 domain-containing protein [Planctomycetota bacterium]